METGELYLLSKSLLSYLLRFERVKRGELFTTYYLRITVP